MTGQHLACSRTKNATGAVNDTHWGERGRVADGPVETMFEVKRDTRVRCQQGAAKTSWQKLHLHLLEHEKEEETRDGGEKEVVDLEQRSELVRWSRSISSMSAVILNACFLRVSFA